MLKSKSLIAAVVITAILFLLSCNKSDVVQVNEIQSTKHLTKIFQDANNYTELTYINNKLSTYQIITNSQPATSITLHYNNEKLPQSEDYTQYNIKYIRKFNYDEGGKVIKSDYLFQDSSENYLPVRYLDYIYNALGQLEKTEQYNYNSTNNNFVHTFDIEYKYDGDGNIIEKDIYSSGNLDTQEIMTYDNKINPLYLLKDYFHYDVSLSKNNILSIKRTYLGGTPQITLLTYSYKYDSEGYPLTSTINISSDNQSDSLQTIYEYQ